MSKFEGRTGAFAYIAAILAMALTLAIPAFHSSITLWENLSTLQLIRAGIWAAGISILPGRLLMRALRLDSGMPFLVVLPLSINLSFVIAGICSFISVYLLGSIFTFSYLLLSLVAVLLVISIKSSPGLMQPLQIRMGKTQLALFIAAAFSSAVSGLVFLRHLYLIPGDEWVALTPAVELISGVDVWVYFERLNYPVFFGFIIAGYSVSMGIPVVNANAMLFPLSALNILTFFAMMKVVFKKPESFSVIASILYAFGGGLGWLLKATVYPQYPFWAISFKTQDIYFMPFAWGSMDFNYKSLAVTMAFASFTLFVLALERESLRSRISALWASSALFLSSFLIHVLPGFLAPIFLIIAFFTASKRRIFESLIFLIAFSAVAFALIDAMAGWINLSLIFAKLPFLSVIPAVYVMAIAGGAAAAAALLVILKRRLKTGELRPSNPAVLWYLKVLIVASIASVYIAGLPYTLRMPIPEDTYVEFRFPWNLYFTRYGIIGLLGFLGAAVSSWRERWFKISVSWCIYAVAIGSVWWGTRLNAYLHPALAILASSGTIWLWNHAPKVVSMGKKAQLPIRAGILVILALSTTSQMYMYYNYATEDPEIPRELVLLLGWVYDATPDDSYVILPEYKDPLVLHVPYPVVLKWQLARGLDTIADRDLVFVSDVNGTDAVIEWLCSNLDPSRPSYLIRIEYFKTPDFVWQVVDPIPVISTGNFSVYRVRSCAEISQPK